MFSYGTKLYEPKVVSYDIIYAPSLSRLKFLINCNLNRGWELQGGVNISEINGRKYWIQAMIYREREEEDAGN